MARKSFKNASLKLVFNTGIDDKTKTKTYSNLVENAAVDDLNAVANSIAGLCKYDLAETIQVVQNEILSL